MTVLEVSELVKAMEEKFGVTAAAPVAVMAGGGAAAAPAEEQTEFTVTLKGLSADDKKIAVIKEVRTVTGLGLKEAKDLVEGAPKTLKENVSKDEAAKIDHAALRRVLQNALPLPLDLGFGRRPGFYRYWLRQRLPDGGCVHLERLAFPGDGPRSHLRFSRR